MSFNLPVELWYEIFSYLNLEDLSRARAVCKSWWDLINCDHLWRLKLLDRRISQHCISAETLGDVNAKALKNCEWADICFKYQETVIRSWALWQPKRTECRPSTECVVICLPYMLKTFDPYSVVDVQLLRNGEFTPWARISLPLDNEEGCYEPQMSTSDAFAISKNSYTMVFKLHGEAFRFEKALAFTESYSLEFCSDESKAPGFLRNSYQMFNRSFMSCLAVTKDVVWLYENINNILVVCDYSKSEMKMRIDVSSEPMRLWPLEPPRVLSTENHIYLILPGELSIYSPHGKRQWLYKQKQATSSSFCWNKFGCGFIEEKNLTPQSTRRFALYYDMFKVSLVDLAVVNPVALTLDETGILAYCLCVREKSVYLVCVSTQTGKVLWESVVCSYLKVQSERLDDYVKMSVILKKYIVIQGVVDKSETFFSPGYVSVYSGSNGKVVGSHSFHPAKVVHLSDNFIITRDRYPRGGMRYKFEIYNFLMPNDNSKTLVKI